MTSIRPASFLPATELQVPSPVTGNAVPVRVTLPKGEVEQVLVFRSGMDVRATDVDGFAQDLTRHGVATFEMESPSDLRPRFDDHAAEIDAVYRAAQQQFPDAKIAVGGESFGADAALRWNAAYNTDNAPIVAMPASIFTKPDVLGPKELAKVFGSIVSDKLENERIATPSAKGLELTTNPNSRLYVDPANPVPVDPSATQPIGNFRDSALLALSALPARWFARGERDPGTVNFVLAGNDQDVYNGATKLYQRFYPDSFISTIEGAAHALTQETHLGIADAVAGWLKTQG